MTTLQILWEDMELPFAIFMLIVLLVMIFRLARAGENDNGDMA